MNSKNNKKTRPGVALLVVLFIVMAITILSLGFVSRSDVELACGQNMILRTELDYLAESGLEHARGLILNPQDVDSVSWTATAQQLVAGSSKYYDLAVVRDDTDPTDRCNYIIDCNSYWIQGPGSISRSNLRATLRLDPCIALWIGSSTTVWPQVTINGDVYCTGDLTNNGIINGDAFATGTITGASIEGKKETVTQAPVAWPNLVPTDFYQMYYIGSTQYSAEPNIPTMPYIPSPSNPAGIRYCVGDVIMPGGVTINGTLVVTGNLKIDGSNTITSVKNFPALVVGGQLVMKDDSLLVINGLAQVEQQITEDPNTTYASISVNGGLFIANDGVTSDKVNINITANPAIASIETWLAMDTASRWSPVAGAFYRSIERK
jgi:hypothetical protein